MSNFYRHTCPICKFSAEDTEILKVCPDCSSNRISNDIPIEDISDDFIDEGDPLEEFRTQLEPRDIDHEYGT